MAHKISASEKRNGQRPIDNLRDSFLLRFVSEIVDNQLSAIKLQEQHRQSLENEVKTLTISVEQYKKNLDNIKRERDRNVSKSQAKTNKMDATQSELATKMKAIVDLTWDLNETRTKLTHTQQQLDTISAEKVALQKSLDAITDDRNDVREKLRVNWLMLIDCFMNITMSREKKFNY